MKEFELGNTGIVCEKNGFGALPIQRISDSEAVELLQMAYEGGMRFFDTARFYTDSEHKLGLAFSGMRDQVYIASKTMCKTTDEFWRQLETTLQELNTDYLDLYQFHNPAFCRSRRVRMGFMRLCFPPRLRAWFDISGSPITGLR